MINIYPKILIISTIFGSIYGGLLKTKITERSKDFGDIIFDVSKNIFEYSIIGLYVGLFHPFIIFIAFLSYPFAVYHKNNLKKSFEFII